MQDESLPEPGNSPAARTAEADSPPGIYVHIPFCLSKCGYCGFYSITDRSLIPGYLAALRREINFYRGWAASFDTLYIGGGTPSVLPAAELEKLIARIRTAFTIATDAEITFEANPADITESLLAALRRSGVNRLNIGVQSFDDGSLALLGRRHTALQAIDAIHRARDAGFKNIGLDLIYGLPSPPAGGKTAAVTGGTKPPSSPAGGATSPEADRPFASWLATLDTAIGLNPEHLSCYQLTIEAGTPLFERCRTGVISPPGEALQAELFFKTSEILEGAGYVHYEISNFARPGEESRHNRKYWDHTPYLGLGPASHSFDGRERRWNHRSVETYIRELAAGSAPVKAAEILTDEQLRLEALFLGFRTRSGIHLETFRKRYGQVLLEEKGEILARLEREGLLEIREGFLRPTRAGMAVADSLGLI
jgi:oxygen-independent coproporphyrinogen-3 oxidase